MGQRNGWASEQPQVTRAPREAETAQSVVAQSAIALAHDVGKQLFVLRALASRRIRGLDDREGTIGDLELVEEIAADAASRLREFVRDATSTRAVGGSVIPLGEAVARAARRVRLRLGDRITLMVEPTVVGLNVPAVVQSVMENLLDNAIQASRDGEFVVLKAEGLPSGMLVSVSDRGAGLTEPQCKAALRLGSSTRVAEGGSGVGLSTAREITHHLGGKLRISSAVGYGTTVEVQLPL